MAALPAAAARRASRADAVAEIITSGIRAVPGAKADLGSDTPHGAHPHTLNSPAEPGMSDRDVPRSAPGEAADVVGRAGHKGVPRPGSDADLLVLGSSPIDAVSPVAGIRAVDRSGGLRAR